MASVPGSILLAASSPYSRRGALWDAHRRYYAKDGPVLVWQAPTTTMNPTIGQRIVDEALERDASVGASEWLAEFRSDLESYVDRDSGARLHRAGLSGAGASGEHAVCGVLRSERRAGGQFHPGGRPQGGRLRGAGLPEGEARAV